MQIKFLHIHKMHFRNKHSKNSIRSQCLGTIYSSMQIPYKDMDYDVMAVKLFDPLSGKITATSKLKVK